MQQLRRPWSLTDANDLASELGISAERVMKRKEALVSCYRMVEAYYTTGVNEPDAFFKDNDAMMKLDTHIRAKHVGFGKFTKDLYEELQLATVAMGRITPGPVANAVKALEYGGDSSRHFAFLQSCMQQGLAGFGLAMPTTAAGAGSSSAQHRVMEEEEEVEVVYDSQEAHTPAKKKAQGVQYKKYADYTGSGTCAHCQNPSGRHDWVDFYGACPDQDLCD
ncbi:hypothetical protein V8C86DRAFT_3198019 [Haematococcus lacustris]